MADITEQVGRDTVITLDDVNGDRVVIIGVNADHLLEDGTILI